MVKVLVSTPSFTVSFWQFLIYCKLNNQNVSCDKTYFTSNRNSHFRKRLYLHYKDQTFGEAAQDNEVIQPPNLYLKCYIHVL